LATKVAERYEAEQQVLERIERIWSFFELPEQKSSAASAEL
jgi:hypothetical protein